jgi:hypothetical protein
MASAEYPEPTNIARQQLRLFLSVAEQTGMDADRQRQSLRLSPDEWHSWLGILQDAPLPSRPALPSLLLQLGNLISRLDRAARTTYA